MANEIKRVKDAFQVFEKQRGYNFIDEIDNYYRIVDPYYGELKRAITALPDEPAVEGPGDLVERIVTILSRRLYSENFGTYKCAVEIADIIPKQIASNSFWVLERFTDGHGDGYWNGLNSRSFVAEIDGAIQFRRREDALPIKSSWHWDDVRITEHCYMPVEGLGDTEMLDWLIEQRRYVDVDIELGKYTCPLVSDSHWTHLIDDQDMFDTPRAAIKAAMEKEQSK